MQVNITSTGVELHQELEKKIQRKLQLTLSRVKPYITTISISLSNSINSRGIKNMHCKLMLVIVNQSDVIVEDTQMDLDCVIDRVLQKTSRMIERLVFNA